MRQLTRYFQPNMYQVYADLSVDEASLNTYLDQLWQIEWHYEVEDMLGHVYTSADYSFHCGVAARLVA